MTLMDGSPATADLFPPFDHCVRQFEAFGHLTRSALHECSLQGNRSLQVLYHTNEFWTSLQRQGNGLHEISYRACFKPQLPAFFIERLTRPGEVVFDPFMGRGTTLIEAALMDRIPMGCDVNPLSQYLVRPRLNPPSMQKVEQRLDEIPWSMERELPDDLLVFYHPQTLREICALRHYLLLQDQNHLSDSIDDWIRMVALNRLTGHSSGFFSVYSMPPNQAVSVASQKRINTRRRQSPPIRDVRSIILKKTRSLLRHCNEKVLQRLRQRSKKACLLTGQSTQLDRIKSESVSLVVTSPPFLDVVDYASDNWLRCWFLGIDSKQLKMTVPGRLDQWEEQMTCVLDELGRVLKPGGMVAMEVGEVRKGTVDLEKSVIRCGVESGFEVLMVLCQEQAFTKTAQCWGVRNNSQGTNSQRIVLFRKPNRRS